ncbi:4Fe-4S dicluster domain-containing protein [uncultured Senegalimassilia sp.]|uniref:4Fe-4S dicluster domain-containing protein n=1 Tax=uncultured Senegalimassilia sp. TaxID=1714350 RepID=UPI00260021CA|nr:4Fe-4S dicluster domain-containing protein [uncultured Senegalimassilia sp.]
MTHYAIVTDLNRCVGCLACSVACKAVNDVDAGNFWNKTLRIGPNKKTDSYDAIDMDMYYLTVQCQHCKDPECVKVCPTEASHIAEDGTVQIDKSKCIGCQFCAMSCPYGVRYLNQEERVVEKCTLCEQKTAQGELPQCVSQCTGIARYFGDLDKGIDGFRGACNTTLKDKVEPYTDADLHHLRNVGNDPSFVYILRRMEWQGEE